MNTIESGDKENKSTKKARPSRPASSSTKKTAPTKHPIQEKLDKIAALEKEISAVIDQREDVVALVREGDEAREEWERSVARYEFLAAEEKKSEAAIDAHRAESDDDRRNSQEDTQEAVSEATGCTRRQTKQNGERHWHSFAQCHGCDDIDERQNRAHRQVNLAHRQEQDRGGFNLGGLNFGQ